MQGVQGGKQAPRRTSGAIAKMEIEILGTFEYLIRVKILGILLSLSEKAQDLRYFWVLYNDNCMYLWAFLF